MPLPPIAALCQSLDAGAVDLCVQFPGGAQICALTESLPPSAMQLARSGLAQVNAALGPLQPVFTIIETISALQSCITAIPDAISQLSPTKISDCLPELAEKVEQLLALLPPASILKLTVDLLDALITMLIGVQAELRALAALQARILNARLISGSANLLSVIDCAVTSSNNQQDNLNRAMASANAIIGLLNSFTVPVGLPEIPTLGDLPSAPLVAIESLDPVIAVLADLRDSIPV